jgi:GT2 family glycosyltransferase
MGLVAYDLANAARVCRGGYIGINYGSGGLVEARNQAVREFLTDSRSEWLFWVDVDMGFAPDTVDRLLEAADPVARPIVGALCFSNRHEAQDGMGGFRSRAVPTIFDWAHIDEAQGFSPRWDYKPNTVTPCAGTGSAGILVHRSVFEQVEEKFGRVWYDRFPNTSTGQLMGEDLAFCMRAGALGIPVHVHTGVRMTHLKTVWLAEEDYWRQRAVEPPPVTVEQLNAAEVANG